MRTDGGERKERGRTRLSQTTMRCTAGWLENRPGKVAVSRKETAGRGRWRSAERRLRADGWWAGRGKGRADASHGQLRRGAGRGGAGQVTGTAGRTKLICRSALPCHSQRPNCIAMAHRGASSTAENEDGNERRSSAHYCSAPVSVCAAVRRGSPPSCSDGREAVEQATPPRPKGSSNASNFSRHTDDRCITGQSQTRRRPLPYF